jgi:hypothetical protein
MSIVVYNKFSLDSILAAALVKSLNKENTIVMDNSSIVPLDHDEYFWLGVELEKPPRWAKSAFSDKKNYSLLATDTEGEGYSSILYKLAIIISNNENKAIPMELIMKLNGCVNKFFTNNATLEDLTLLFVNLKIAERALYSTSINTEDFRDIDCDGLDTVDFKRFIKIVKDKNRNNYTHQYIKFKSRLLETFVTSVNDDWIWIKRLLSLSDQKYVNINMTPIGCIVDTNLPDFDKHRIDIGVKLANIY